jgi:hypothetical protein
LDHLVSSRCNQDRQHRAHLSRLRDLEIDLEPTVTGFGYRAAR